jgi:putative spermidine/putrescine transport system permease protein
MSQIAAASGAAGRRSDPGSVRARRSAGILFDRVLTFGWCAFVYLFLLLPLVVIVGASFDAGTGYAAMVFPPQDLTLKWYFKISNQQYQALALSVGIALLTAILACLLGVPAAMGLVRGNVPGKLLLSAFFRMPLQIPSIVIGLSFLNLYYAMGRMLDWNPAGTFTGLAIGHFFHVTPYVIGTTAAVLQRFDSRLDEAARTLGASPWRTFRRVTLPVIAPGIYAGALYSFMVSFGDVPISMFLTRPGFATYPVELYFSLESAFDPSILASSTLVIVFSLVIMLLVQRMVGLNTLLQSRGNG